jgi:hypothetical protein
VDAICQVYATTLADDVRARRAVFEIFGGVMQVMQGMDVSVQTWSAPPRNHDWLAACITLG